MRTELKKLGLHKTLTFVARVDTFGKTNKKSTKINTVCLVKVSNHSHVVTDHVWTMLAKMDLHTYLQVGDVIKFTAEVVKYQKGYKGHDERLKKLHPIKDDYSLTNYRNIRVIK